jgi:hypothetical protein
VVADYGCDRRVMPNAQEHRHRSWGRVVGGRPRASAFQVHRSPGKVERHEVSREEWQSDGIQVIGSARGHHGRGPIQKDVRVGLAAKHGLVEMGRATHEA